MRQTVGSDTTNYLWDELSAYGDVVRETNGTGTELASYTLAGSQLLAQTRSGVTSYYLSDGQGSTRALLNGTGDLTDTYDYTAFGEIYNQTGSTLNNYLYTGQQFDSLTGLYSLRARYYDPSVGRFVSRDTYPINYQNPIELNRYGYTANNPINRYDPSGRSLFELSAQKMVIGGLTGGAVGAVAGFVGSTIFYVAAWFSACGSPLRQWAEETNYFDYMWDAVKKGAAYGVVGGVAAATGPVLGGVLLGYGIVEGYKQLSKATHDNPEAKWCYYGSAAGATIASILTTYFGFKAWQWYKGSNRPPQTTSNDPDGSGVPGTSGDDSAVPPTSSDDGGGQTPSTNDTPEGQGGTQQKEGQTGYSSEGDEIDTVPIPPNLDILPDDLVPRIVNEFRDMFGADPEAVYVVGSYAEKIQNPAWNYDLSNSDIDVFIQTNLGLHKSEGMGFEYFKAINPGKVPEGITGLGIGPTETMIGGNGLIPKAGTIDPFFGSSSQIWQPAVRIWP